MGRFALAPFLRPAARSPGQLPCSRFSSFRRPLRRQGEPCVGLLPSGQHPDPPRHPVGEGHRGHLLRLAFRHPFRCASHVLFSIPPGGEDDLRHSYGTVPGRTGIPKPPLLSMWGGAPGCARAPSRSTWVWNGNSDLPEPHTPRSRWRMSMPRQRGLLPSGPTSSGTERSRTSVAPRSRSRGQSPGIRAAGATGRRRLPALTGTRSGSRGHRRATAGRAGQRLISPMKQTAGRDPGRTPTHSGNAVPPKAL